MYIQYVSSMSILIFRFRHVYPHTIGISSPRPVIRMRFIFYRNRRIRGLDDQHMLSLKLRRYSPNWWFLTSNFYPLFLLYVYVYDAGRREGKEEEDSCQERSFRKIWSIRGLGSFFVLRLQLFSKGKLNISNKKTFVSCVFLQMWTK